MCGWFFPKTTQILMISSMTLVIACNKGYGGGWGEPQLIWKPTLIPKLKQAFIDGKLSVDYHKIIAPSLKPLPYKKGVGWIGKGWLPHGHGHGLGLGYGGHGYGFNAIVCNILRIFRGDLTNFNCFYSCVVFYCRDMGMAIMITL